MRAINIVIVVNREAGIMYAFNRSNLAAVGILEDICSLYNIMITAMEDVANEYFSNVGTIRNSVKKILKKPLNNYLNANRYMFTPDSVPIYLNAWQFEHMYSLAAPMKPMKGYYTVDKPSLTSFLKAVEDATFLRLVNMGYFKGSFYGSRYSVREARTAFDQHIQAVADEYRSRITTEYLTDISPVLVSAVVYKSLYQVSCNLSGHNVVPTRQSVALLTGHKYIELPIHHCRTCGKDFVGEQTLKVYSNEYGKMYIATRSDNTNENNYYLFPEQSELYSFGYNVQKDGLSEIERRTLLVSLVDEQYMTHFSICRDLEGAICRFQHRPNYQDAVDKWKKDLRFINDYIVKKQTKNTIS